MNHERYEVVVSALEPGDAETLGLDLARAAIRADRCSDGRSIVVASGANRIFSTDDVLDVVADWIEKKPERFATASIAVQRTCGRSRPGSVHRRNVSPAPIRAR